MKKLYVMIAAMLCCCPTYSQEGEEENKLFELTIIPRLEANPAIKTADNGYGSVDWGNSSLTTNLSGSFSDALSYNLETQWLSDYPKYLYKGTRHSDESTWLKYANISYAFGHWTATLGKDALNIGTFEWDNNDYDVHYNLATNFWHNIASYQWGAKLAYTSPSEATTVAFQWSTSPLGHYFFKSKLYNYALTLSGEYGNFSTIDGISLMEYEKGKFMSLITLGGQWTAGKWQYGLDYMNRAIGGQPFWDQEMSVLGTLQFSPNEKTEIFGKLGYEFRHGEYDLLGYGDEWEADNTITPCGIETGKGYVFGGLGVHWYPLANSRDLRIHAVAATNNYADAMSLSVGATWLFTISK